MSRLALDQIAPDFSLSDYSGKPFALSGLRGKKAVLLVFNRTFV